MIIDCTCANTLTKLRQNFDKKFEPVGRKTVTKWFQKLWESNPKLSKTRLGVREAAPDGYFVEFGSIILPGLPI